MNKNKYLEKIGVKSYLETFAQPDDKRHKDWKKERKVCGGYDERDTWSMELPYTEWLYTHVCMYEEAASGIIDMTFHHIHVDKKIYTQKEAIKKLKKNLKFVLKNYDNFELEGKVYKKLRQSNLIWTELLPMMWW